MENDFGSLFEEDLGFDEPLEDVEGKQDVLGEDSDIFEQGFDSNEKIKTNTTVLDDFLALKGIKNSSLKIREEDNTEKEVSFYDLTKEEQLELLNSFTETKEVDSNDPEIKFLNSLKEKNLSLKSYLDLYKQDIIKELESQKDPIYEIDAYDDQELYLLDLKTKFDLTDEELISELEKELEKPELFKKKTDALRKEYKNLEDQYKQTEQANFEKQREEEYNQFSEKMVDVAIKTPEFYGIELEDAEKNEVLSYLLDLDENGTSNFYKELNTPEKLYEAAWFLKYGKSAFDALRDAYESEIAKIKKDSKQRVVVLDNKKSNSIHDLI